MSVTYATVPISVITELQDYLGNHGAEDFSSWEVEIRLYRANASSFGQEAKNRLLFTIWASHEPNNFYVTPSERDSASEESKDQSDGVLATPAFQKILDSKLKSLWQLRQTFKGEGRVLRCDDGGEIRISNILVQGNYKGLLVDADSTPQCAALVRAMGEEFQIRNVESVEEPAVVPANNSVERAKLYQRVYQ